METSIVDRFNSIAQSWECTPFREGLAAKKVGVDCLRFVFCLLCELYNKPSISLPRLSPDSSYHVNTTVKEILELFVQNFSVAKALGKPKGLDILLLSESLNEHHVAIVAPDLYVWDACRDFGVRKSRLPSLLHTFKLRQIWRMPNALVSA